MGEIPTGAPADGAGQQGHSRWSAMAALLKHDAPPAKFLHELLTTLCRIAPAERAVVMRPREKNRVEVLAAFPRPGAAGAGLEWVPRAGDAARQVVASGESAMVPENTTHGPGGGPLSPIVLVPVKSGQTVRAVAAFLVQVHSQEEMTTCRERLEMAPFLLDHYELRSALRQRHGALERLRLVLEMLAAVNRPERFKSACMALCNEMATRLRCQRVSLGCLEGRYVRVQAISHTDTFRREAKLAQDIEAAMEECLDQDVEVIYPAASNAPYASRAATRLAVRHGPAAVLSLPLRHHGEVFGVLTLERPQERPFGALTEVEIVRLACELCGPRLFEMHARERWAGARAEVWARRRLSALIGPEHTWLKAGACAVFCLALFLTWAKGDHRIDASFIFEAPLQQAVVAPFDTFLKSVAVDPGDEVEADKDTLGLLDATDLRLKLAAVKAEQLGYLKQMAAAMRDGKTADAQIAQAQSDKSAAEMRLLERHIEQATLTAPITGRVVSEDLKRQIGAPVETGKVLFEIASIEALRAELYVPEESITHVSVGQTGELASVSHPEQKIRFRVERIHPMAEVVNSQNVFRVRAGLLEQHAWMRPGMEGVAKITAGEKSYLWMSFYRLTNWLRMKLWF
jgi:GAF domain-containing protein/biotin carboxyl carrier protein